ncbi:MAG: XRE family transcriptional regulator [Myxococcota bacterium]
MAHEPADASQNLAQNLRYLRTRRGLTQARLAALCDLPRSTLANLESSAGNPTLAVLCQLASALRISVEELIGAPRGQARVVPSAELPVEQRGSGGRSSVRKLLPDPVPGMEIDRMALAPGHAFKGVPHRPGTREWYYGEAGVVRIVSAGQVLEVGPGDVASFNADQPHSYRNVGEVDAIGFSVVALAPL